MEERFSSKHRRGLHGWVHITPEHELTTAGGILMASSAQTNLHVLAGPIGPSRIAKPAALLAIALTVIALLLLASLHLLSPEFAPS
jgi:hypothetical protein